MRSKKSVSQKKTIWAWASSSLVLSLVVFGCSRGSSPVSPRGLDNKGRLNLEFHFPKAMVVSDEVHAMVSHPDFGQLETSAVPQVLATATSYPYTSSSQVHLSLEVQAGPDRNVMVGFHSSFYNEDLYAFTRMDVAPGPNPLALVLTIPSQAFADNYYVGGFYDFDTLTTSLVNIPGVSDVEFFTVFDGVNYHWDLRDISGLNSASRVYYVGNFSERPLYGMAPAPAALSAYKGFGWNYPTNDGAKGGANGYIDYGDVFLVRTTMGNLVWFNGTGIYAYGYPSDSLYMGVVFGCGSDLPSSIVPCL